MDGAGGWGLGLLPSTRRIFWPRTLGVNQPEVPGLEHRWDAVGSRSREGLGRASGEYLRSIAAPAEAFRRSFQCATFRLRGCHTASSEGYPSPAMGQPRRGFTLADRLSHPPSGRQADLVVRGFGALESEKICTVACRPYATINCLTMDSHGRPERRGRQLSGPRQGAEVDMIWLMIWMGAGTPPVHVGTFADVPACIAAAKASQALTTNRPSPSPPPITWVCVMAGLEKTN
jgi:hypothetical protein